MNTIDKTEEDLFQDYFMGLRVVLSGVATVSLMKDPTGRDPHPFIFVTFEGSCAITNRQAVLSDIREHCGIMPAVYANACHLLKANTKELIGRINELEDE